MKSKYTFERMELDGETVAVPVGNGASEFHAVLYLNEEAWRIIELLQEDTTEQAIVKQLVSEYDSTEETILPFVREFVEQMRSEGILDD